MIGGKEKIFKTVIILIFIVFLFGCSGKYYTSPKEEMDGGRVVDSWRELDADAIRVYEGKVLLNVRVEDFVKDRGALKELLKQGSGKSGSSVVNGLIGCLGVGCAFAGLGLAIANPPLPSIGSEVPIYMPVSYRIGCAVAGGVAGGLMLWGVNYSESSGESGVIPDESLIGAMCARSVVLSEEEIMVVVKNANFEEVYCTDEDGNIELVFDEIIPEPTDADSVLNVIIQYYELVDTVKVIRL